MGPFNIHHPSAISAPNPAKKPDLATLNPTQKKELEKLNKACKEFESIFVYQMMKEMRKSVKKTGLIHGGQAETIFRDMLDQEQAKDVSIGIGSMLYRQLSKAIIPPPRRS